MVLLPLSSGVVCSADLVSSCPSIVDHVRSLGFLWILSLGGPGLYIGKGFSSYVILVMDSRGLMAALKIRRTRSKRDSLYLEGYVLELLSKSGVTPRVFIYGGDFVLMEYIWGIDLEEVVDLYMVGYIGEEYLRRALASALRALYILDKLGVDHLEVGNPARHVIYRNSIPSMARIIDFESSHPSPSPSNIPRFVGGFLIRRFWWLLNIKPHDLRAMMRRYKKDPGSREEVFRELLRIISRERLS